MLTYLDILPSEILDMIFLYTDIDSMILFNRYYCVRKYLSIKKNLKKFNWTDAAKEGKIHRMKYMLENGITAIYSSTLLYHSLSNGHIDCAQWMWNHGKQIRTFLYPKRHQRNYNQLAKTDTLEQLLRLKRKQEALWLLKNTSVPYCLHSLTYLDDTDKLNADIAFEMLTRQRFAKPDGNKFWNRCFSVKEELLLRNNMIEHILDGNFPKWWSACIQWSDYIE